ncbi:glycosyltransferase family 2 protein [Clostridium botulinum]|uniref:glycosyltransferase family 2 protein n=1 Tax=Clostridium sporogenes TaxID=1509 RepID=UPI0005F93606|nr:glycosyltransferase family 2 protein [Clostridium sporogenes]EJE7236644.1 glycosyltransferase family 2 protein [Clostridium botulinum]EKO1914468.1 glycosyltransferase family 2 protein [Clostridium botulinum]EKO2044510.1 glycosyltransferase family 2 protein [Clostridium botulinum]NFE82241.1 glycosyltransferase family 2 protein [Clostridium sporogenes]NFG69445.1 glycosyltransferase family 2 protein [Clostridium sporogenes]
MKLSIIIPAYNEGSAIKITYKELTRILEKDSLVQNYNYELIFIDDGSKDETLDVIKELPKKDSHVKFISFTRNFGKEAGMLAGLTYSTGDAIILIDADLQHPPELICDMVKYYYNGYNQVIAKRNRVGDPKTTTVFSKLYYKIVNHFVDIKLTDGIGDFRLLSRQAVNALLSMKEYNRFSKGMFSWIGFDEKIIEYKNQNRVCGDTKWNFKQLIQYGMDGILSFNNKPLRSILYLGFIMVLLGIAYILYSLIRIMSVGIDMPGYFTTITAILVIGGIQLLSLGVIGEYIGRIYYEVKKRPHFLIKETNISKNIEKDIETSECNKQSIGGKL